MRSWKAFQAEITPGRGGTIEGHVPLHRVYCSPHTACWYPSPLDPPARPHGATVGTKAPKTVPPPLSESLNARAPCPLNRFGRVMSTVMSLPRWPMGQPTLSQPPHSHTMDEGSLRLLLAEVLGLLLAPPLPPPQASIASWRDQGVSVAHPCLGLRPRVGDDVTRWHSRREVVSDAPGLVPLPLMQVRVRVVHEAAQLRLRGTASLLLLHAQAREHGGREAQVPIPRESFVWRVTARSFSSPVVSRARLLLGGGKGARRCLSAPCLGGWSMSGPGSVARSIRLACGESCAVAHRCGRWIDQGGTV